MIVSGPLERSCSVDAAASALGLSAAWVRKKLADPDDPLGGLAPQSEHNPGRGWRVDAVALDDLLAQRRLGASTRIAPPRRPLPLSDDGAVATALKAELDRTYEELRAARAQLAEQARDLVAAQSTLARLAEREALLLREELAGALDAIDALTSKRRSRLLSDDLAASPGAGPTA